MCKTCLGVLNRYELVRSLSDTNLMFIPKTRNLRKVLNFRRISLCNVIFKMITKAIANKIKGLLPMVISECQSAFVLGRLITDKIITFYEVIRCIKVHRWAKKGLMAVKLMIILSGILFRLCLF